MGKWFSMFMFVSKYSENPPSGKTRPIRSSTSFDSNLNRKWACWSSWSNKPNPPAPFARVPFTQLKRPQTRSQTKVVSHSVSKSMRQHWFVFIQITIVQLSPNLKAQSWCWLISQSNSSVSYCAYSLPLLEENIEPHSTSAASMCWAEANKWLDSVFVLLPLPTITHHYRISSSCPLFGRYHRYCHVHYVHFCSK